MRPTRVSIVIPTRNGIDTLPDLLQAIRSQRFDGGVEIIAVDSGSTDGSLTLLGQQADKTINVPPGQFDHGLTRNLAVEAAAGDLVVLIVQDAVPQTERWLTALTAPLLADATLAGTFARQIPRSDASRLTLDYHRRWIAAGLAAFISSVESRESFDRLTPAERHRRCAFDNVCSCIRRSVWESHPFRATPMAEDLEWARDVLLAGHRIAFVPDAVVMHSHERAVAYEFSRTRAAHERLFVLFGLRQVPGISDLALAVTSSMARHLWCERFSPARWPRAAGLAIAWPLGQYLGARRGARLTGRGVGSER